MISKRIVIISICIFAILSIPLISMQYTEEVNWSVQDFIIAAILFLGAGISLEYIFKKNYELSYDILDDENKEPLDYCFNSIKGPTNIFVSNLPSLLILSVNTLYSPTRSFATNLSILALSENAPN